MNPMMCEILANGDRSVVVDDPIAGALTLWEPMQCYRSARRIRKAVARFHDMDEAYVYCGYGVDQLVNLLLNQLGRSKTTLMFWPSYPFGEVFARIAGAFILRVPLETDGRYPEKLAPEVVEREPTCIFLVNPSNPVGRSLDRSIVETYIKQCPEAWFIIDEAYIDFCVGLSLLPLVADGARVVVVRSLSKGYGLPGARVGYAFGPCALIEQLETVHIPFFSPLSEQTAIAALGHPTLLSNNIEYNIALKEKLHHALASIHGLAIIDTETNFLLVEPDHDVDMAALQRACMDHGLVFWWFNETQNFRDYFSGDHPALSHRFRISVVEEDLIDAIHRGLSMATESVMR